MSDEEYILYAGRFADELTVRLGKEVDAVPINIADTILKYEIFFNGKLIYCRDISEYDDDKLNALDEYLDYKEHFERHYKRILDEILGRR